MSRKVCDLSRWAAPDCLEIKLLLQLEVLAENPAWRQDLLSVLVHHSNILQTINEFHAASLVMQDNQDLTAHLHRPWWIVLSVLLLRFGTSLTPPPLPCGWESNAPVRISKVWCEYTRRITRPNILNISLIDNLINLRSSDTDTMGERKIMSR